MKNKVIRAGKFTLCILPFALVGGIAVSYYEMGTGMVDAALQMMSESSFILMAATQALIYAVVCGFLGFLLADAVSLVKSFCLEKRTVLYSILIGGGCGVFFFLADYLFFANQIPGVKEYYATYPFSVSYLLSKLFYGGVIEEVMLRWFMMSLLVFLLWKAAAPKKGKDQIPGWIYVTANLLAAVLFAIGHLPATILMFGHLDFILVFRCLLLNAGFGIVYGYLYRKNGVQYGMIAHAMTHVACDSLLFLSMH